MRTLSTALAANWFNGNQEPVYVVALTFSSGNTIYITSHTISGLSGANVFNRFLVHITGTTAQIQPEHGRSSIGNISFTALDADNSLSERIALEDESGNGLRHRVARIYFGLAGMSWSEFNTANDIIQTQIVTNLSVDGNQFTFDCSDVQRTTRQSVFRLAKTKLTATIEADSLLIPVSSVTGSAQSPQAFQKMYHGPTFTDAPLAEVGYVQIDDEFIRWTGTTVDGTLGLCLVADKRGALNSIPARHEIPTSTNDTNGKEVREIVYLEMPAVELLYGLLTGSYYSQPGKFFPDGWHLNIPGEFIRTSTFLNVGQDLWNGENGGFISRFVGETEQDAKAFMSKQIAMLASVTAIPFPNGELGVKRLNNVLHSSPYVFTLDRTNIIRHSELVLDYEAISNVLSIEWNYDPLRKILTRQKILLDSVSRAKYEDAPEKTLQFRGLHGSRHSTTTIEGLFDRLRDRYAGPPYRISVTCQPWCGHLEIGDIVRLTLPHVSDPLTGTTLDRSFEIQQVDIDWITGLVTFELFGSAMPSSVIAPEDPGEEGETPSSNVIPDSAYTALGTNLATYPGVTIVPSGGVGHITGGSGLVGGNTLDEGRYYYDGDLELDSGVVLPFTKNVQLWVKGHLQINGTFDGTARGQLGAQKNNLDGDVALLPDNLPPFNSAYQTDVFNSGLKGYIGPTVSDGGITTVQTDNSWVSVPGNKTDGTVTSVPFLEIKYQSNKILGLPSALWGTSGCSGRASSIPAVSGGVFDVGGGAGGDSGAGIAFVSRGASFGASGLVKTNGGQSEQGNSTGNISYVGGVVTELRDQNYAGSGAGGAPGAALFIIDGLLSDTPTLQNVEAKYGQNKYPEGRTFGDPAWQSTVYQLQEPVVNVLSSGMPNNAPKYTYYHRPVVDMSGINGGASRVLFVPPVNTPTEDDTTDPGSGDTVAQPPTALAVTEVLNTPPSPAGNLSSLEITVTPPSPLGAYRYADIFYRVVGQNAWVYGTAASHEGVIVVPTDGTEYEFEARAVSKDGVRLRSGPRTTFTVSDVINDVPGDDQVPQILIVPNVTGLEIAGQGNNTDFTGPNVTIAWRRSTDREWKDPITGKPAGSGAQDQYFSHYQIFVYDADNGELLREVIRTTPQLTYDLAMNEEDSARVDRAKYRPLAGPRRELQFEVYQWSRQNRSSLRPAKLTVRNPAPDNITGVDIAEGAYSARFSYTRPADADFVGMEIWVDTSPGFTPSELNQVMKGPDTALTLVGLQSAVNYYLRYRPYDAFGPGDMSDELVFTTTAVIVDPEDLGLGPWATRVDPVDAAFITAQLTADAIPSEKIANLAVGKLTAGVLLVTMTIQTEGSIRVVNGSYETRIGVHNVSGTDYAIRTSDGVSSPFSVSAAGVLRATGAIISGQITITGGSGYANLGDKPTSLSGINATEGTKLSGIETGATVGANWGTNVSGRPTELTDGRVSAGLNAAGALRQIVRGTDLVAGTVATGLNMSSTRLGYYNGTTWTVYIANDGTFLFQGNASNFIQWNGSTLTLQGTLNIQGGSGYANLSDKPTTLSGINSGEGAKLSGIATGATADLTLVVGSNMSVVGNKATKISGSGSWNASVYSKESHTGGAYVTFTADQSTAAIMVGLNTDPTTGESFTDIDYAIYVRTDGKVSVYNNGSNLGEKSASYVAGDVFSVIYDGVNVYYTQNGTIIFTQAVSAGQKLYLDSSFSSLGSVSNIKFGPMTVGTQASMNSGVTITGGGITMSAGGSIKGGKTAPGSGVGFFLGYSGSNYQLDVGDTAAEKFVRFDGVDLIVGANTNLVGVGLAGSADIYISRENVNSTEYTVEFTNTNGVSFSTATGSIRLAAVFGDPNGSHSRVYFTRGNYVIGTPNWDNDTTFSCYVGKDGDWIDGFTRAEAFVGSGNWDETTNANHIGFVFKTVSGTFISCGTGSSRTETNISSTNLTGTFTYKRRGSTVTFYHNGSSVGSITTNLPSGTTDAKLHFNAKVVRTAGGGGSPSIFTGEWRFLQKE